MNELVDQVSAHHEQLLLDLDWGLEPWNGWAPRYLTRGSCVVDNSDVESESGDAPRLGPDPVQLTLFLKGNPNGS